MHPKQKETKSSSTTVKLLLYGSIYESNPRAGLSCSRNDPSTIHKRPPAVLPMQAFGINDGFSPHHAVTFVNPSAEGLPQEDSPTREGEEYAEILPRTSVLVKTTPEPYICPIQLKEATHEDYNNEELYMKMAKIYFEDPVNILASYEINRSRVHFIEEIGKGEFGRVMKASAEHVIPGQTSSIVAVKMLKEKADENTKKNFLSEAQLLAKFGSHPNVMGLLKVVCQSSPQLVIISYMPHGDLKHYLRNHSDSVKILDQLSISEQIADGMEYLAGKFFIHRDLAARNVLVGDNNSVKISDFGLSRILAKNDSYYKLSHTSKLPVRWMALESLLYQKFSTYSDVWSFGVVLWEIFSFGQSPYMGIKGMNISRHVQKGGRLACPEDCPREIYELMQDCWKIAKEERPTFTQLKLQLKALAIKLATT